jgi:hypothetical protein
MKKVIAVLPVLLALFSLVSCGLNTERAPIPGFGFRIKGLPQKTVSEEEQAFYMAVNFGTLNEVESFLKAGHDPNYMNYPGAIPWHETNPLWSIGADYEKTKLLICWGANVTKRPYVAALTSGHILSARFPNEMFYGFFQRGGTIDESEVYPFIQLYLESGADPNLKYWSSNLLYPPTDRTYLKYYKKHGISAINAAITTNLFTIVDLLFEYGAILDDESFECAKKATGYSLSTDMADHVKALWEKQQAAK